MEDNPRRLQRRIDKILSPVSTEWPKRLSFATSWKRLDKGGVDDIAQWADSVSNPRLCILDTLAGVRPIRTRDGYVEDYESLATLHRLASERGLAVLVLHHTRKMEAEDPIDTISGTLGLAGCADTALIISRTAQGTTFYVRGRDIEEAENAISFDKHTCRWTILGTAAEVHRSNERGQDFGCSIECNRIAWTAADLGLHPDEIGQCALPPGADGSGRRGYEGHQRAVLSSRPGRTVRPPLTVLTTSQLR